jgi:hypothetical protein
VLSAKALLFRHPVLQGLNQIELLLGAGNGDIEQASFFFQVFCITGVLGILPPNTAKTSEAPVFASL